MEIKWTSLIQRLLNLLRDNNSKVCQVGEALTSQTADCCNDMQQLIQSLQQHVISNSTINHQNSYVENSTSEIMNNDNNNNNNNSSTQEALRRKYGDSGFQTPNKNSVSPSVIMQVAESVLDFSNVLQYEVLQAAEALRMITNDTLRETENL
ncbi:hypothetical protein ADEAN_000439000 [Angomonas deanei]|uniref:Uncharacterized protein n=1 Tax=Angomonas deanei TaxID=59799 RepID=A0A7G2CFJ0_9TRYP|nr:hypothetical protein ADEAN_000439000 [Angomonas deanei]